MIFAAIEAIEDAGDRAFLLSLYREYHLLMFATARKYLSSQADCEDVVQSSLEQLIKHVDTLRELPHYAVISYITATVRNTAFNLLDDEAKFSSRFVPLEESQEGEPSPGPITADEMMLLLHRRELISRVMEGPLPRGPHAAGGQVHHGLFRPGTGPAAQLQGNGHPHAAEPGQAPGHESDLDIGGI